MRGISERRGTGEAAQVVVETDLGVASLTGGGEGLGAREPRREGSVVERPLGGDAQWAAGISVWVGPEVLGLQACGGDGNTTELVADGVGNATATWESA